MYLKEKIKKEILERFYLSKNKNYKKLTKEDWNDMEKYIKSFEIGLDTTFEQVIKAYYECISQWER